MNRQNQILTAVLVAQIVILGLVFWPKTSAAEGQPVFEGLDPEQIVSLFVSDINGQQIQMHR